jgi:hypothetical protein
VAAKDIITLLIALYGAGLSTFVFVHGMRREKRRISIKQTTSFFTFPNGDLGPPMVNLEVVNEGHRQVTVSAPVLRLPSGKQLAIITQAAIGSSKFPARLEDGDTATLRVEYQVITRTLQHVGIRGKIKLIPVCSDTTGKDYEGDEWEFDVEEDWSKL